MMSGFLCGAMSYFGLKRYCRICPYYTQVQPKQVCKRIGSTFLPFQSASENQGAVHFCPSAARARASGLECEGFIFQVEGLMLVMFSVFNWYAGNPQLVVWVGLGF